MAFSETEVKRITILSLISSATQAGANSIEDAYNEAVELVGVMVEDGLFDSGSGNSRSSRPSGRSGGRASSSRQSNRGNSRGNSGGQGMRDPDGPPTDKQVNAVLKFTDEYTEDQLYDDFTKQTISDLIDDLGIFN